MPVMTIRPGSITIFSPPPRGLLRRGRALRCSSPPPPPHPTPPPPQPLRPALTPKGCFLPRRTLTSDAPDDSEKGRQNLRRQRVPEARGALRHDGSRKSRQPPEPVSSTEPS